MSCSGRFHESSQPVRNILVLLYLKHIFHQFFLLSNLYTKQEYLLISLFQYSIQKFTLKFKLMNNELNTDKIFIKQDAETAYIVHIVTNQTTLWIQIQNKLNGDIWNGQFGSEKIQQITQKAKNPKKFHIFIKMLLTSLGQKSGSVITQILSYAQLQKRMNLSRKTSNNQTNKKFMIMTYISQFQKTHYPLPLLFDQNPAADRLKVTIRRLSQQLQLNCQQKGDSDGSKYLKQVSMLKYQNQTLKAKLKNSQAKLRYQSKENQNMNKSNLMMEETEQQKKIIQNLKKQNQNKDNQIQTFKSKLSELEKQSSKKDNTILNLKEQVTNLKEELSEKQNNKQFEDFSDKLAQMAKQTVELVSELQHSRQQQKKSTLRILNLEKQLEQMINLQQQKKPHMRSKYIVVDSSPMRSSRKSQVQKSQKSFKSHSSKKSYNSNNSKNSKNSKTNPLISYLTKNKNLSKKPATKKSSVYDSDTQSSKMRRNANNKVSPFRQTSKPMNSSPKNKGKTIANNTNNPLNNNRLQSGRNIANNFQARNRSRSKSRSVKQQVSPPQNIYQGGSSDQEGVLAVLRARRQNPKRSGKAQKTNVLGPVQEKISKIAQMLRNAKKRQ